MKNLLGAIGGKGSTRNLLRAIISELYENGVCNATWEQCLKDDNLEDVVEQEWHHDTLTAVVSAHPDKALKLADRCVNEMERVVRLDAENLDDGSELALVNAMVILAHLLTVGPGKMAPGSPQQALAPGAPMKTLQGMMWAASAGGERLLGERIIDATMQALFTQNFTIAELDGKPTELVDGVEPLRLWQDGVGPTGALKSDNGVRPNRQLALQLLAAAICGSVPAIATNAARTGDKPQQAQADTIDKPLFMDDGPLAYLCNDQSSVPFRGELLYSLLSVVLGYDPRGFGLPYIGHFAGTDEEDFVALCIQVLILLLQDATDAQTVPGTSIVECRPQEFVHNPQTWQFVIRSDDNRHVFRSLLAKINTQEELGFMIEGVVSLLNTVTEERNTYLPSSMRVPVFLPELLVLIFHLTCCEHFVGQLVLQDDVQPLVEGILHVACQETEYLHQDSISIVSGATLLRLSAYRDVCLALAQDFDGDVPDDLPEFQGSFADLVSLAALKQASDRLATAGTNRTHFLIVEIYLCIFLNVSSFAEDLRMEVSIRFFALFERCTKVVLAKRSGAGAANWLPRLLEAIVNVLQYQYGSNPNIVYGLMTRRTMLSDLAARIAELSNGEEGAKTSEATDGDPRKLAAPNWSKEMAAILPTIVRLVEGIAPKFEAEVEKNEVSSPEEAKQFLPKCALGLLPAPHPFTMRSLRHSAVTHRACEQCIVDFLANGPLALWDVDSKGGQTVQKPEPKKPAKKATPPASAARPRARERSSSRQRPAASPAARGERGSSRSLSRARRHSSSPPAGLQNVAPDLQAQLQAAAANGVDIAALLQALQAQQGTATPDANGR